MKNLATHHDSAPSQRVQVREQILNILRAQSLAIARHIRPAIANDVADALVIRRQPAERKILMLKCALQAGPLLALRGIRPVAAVAVVIVDLASRSLLRIEAEFGV